MASFRLEEDKQEKRLRKSDGKELENQHHRRDFRFEIEETFHLLKDHFFHTTIWVQKHHFQEIKNLL